MDKGPEKNPGGPINEYDDVTTERSFLPNYTDGGGKEEWIEEPDESDNKGTDERTDDYVDYYGVTGYGEGTDTYPIWTDGGYEDPDDECDIDNNDDDCVGDYEDYEEIVEGLVPTTPSVEATIATLVTLSPGLDVVTMIPFPSRRPPGEKPAKRKPHLSKSQDSVNKITAERIQTYLFLFFLYIDLTTHPSLFLIFIFSFIEFHSRFVFVCLFFFALNPSNYDIVYELAYPRTYSCLVILLFAVLFAFS